MAIDNFCTKVVSSASLGPTPKRCELPFFFAALGQAIRGWKALDLRGLNMQFQKDWPKDKNITALLYFCLKTEKFRSTELYGTPLEGSTILLQYSAITRTPLESSALGELKSAISPG